MRGRRISAVFVCALLVCVPKVDAWWTTGHQHIAEGALKHLPPTLGAYFRANRTTLKGFAGQEPLGTHYIDIDAYAEFDPANPFSVSRDIDELIALHGQAFVDQNGTGPWTLDNHIQLLTLMMAAATTAEDWNALLLPAGWVAHYVGDLHNPLHLTANYDGQATGNWGVHARFEGELIWRNLNSLTIAPAPVACVYWPSPIDAIFDDIYVHYPFVDAIMAADTLSAGNPPSYSEAYYDSLWNNTGAFTQVLFQEASEALASAWYTAWIDAGSPEPIFPPGDGDMDLDGDVDLRDLAGLQSCYTSEGQGPAAVGCAGLDADADTDVDLTDWTILSPLVTGPLGATIAQAQQVPPGVEVTIGQAVISCTTDLDDHPWRSDFYIQDDTGGLRVWGHRYDIEAVLHQFSDGDRIRFVGKLDESGGVLQLIAFFDVLGTFDSPGPPVPDVATAADFQDGSSTADSLKGKLVTLQSAQFLQPSWFQPTTRLTATTADGDVIIWIATEDLDLAWQATPATPVDLVGIFGQSDNSVPLNGNYELWLTSLSP